MKPTLAREIVLDALLMAVLRRNPQQRVLIHSDQDTQFGSDDWRRFCRELNLEPSMSRPGVSSAGRFPLPALSVAWPRTPSYPELAAPQVVRGFAEAVLTA